MLTFNNERKFEKNNQTIPVMDEFSNTVITKTFFVKHLEINLRILIGHPRRTHKYSRSKSVNMITFGQNKVDNINRIRTRTD